VTNKILVPLDGSKLGESVLPWAKSLARDLDAGLLLVRVIASRGGTEYQAGGVHRRHTPTGWHEAEVYLERQKRTLEAEGLDIHTRVRHGLVAENILDLAAEERTSLIALATHGRRGIARFFLGSVAEGLVHDARIPLFLVPADAPRRGAPRLRRILVPLDGSQLAERALEYAADLVGRRPIILFRAVSIDDIEADVPNTLLVEHEAFSRAERDAREYLDGIAQRLAASGHTIEASTARGRPAQEVAIAARAAGADLIVMASHGRTGAERARLGSVADEVVRHGELPVLLISARALAARTAGEAGITSIIRRNSVFVDAADSVAIVLRKMASRRVSEVIVVDGEGRLEGLLSQGNLAAWAQCNLGREIEGGLRQFAEDQPVAALLSRDSVSLEPSASLADAMTVLAEERLEAAPVVQDGRVIGVVNLQDVLAAILVPNEITSLRETALVS
jgi:nucleotide-binding universal stress UspA family protein/predicted transcriptional regulator